MYGKRAGTAGISGHLYETKLLSLLYFRACRDDRITEFQLASNIADVGAFDDICFKAKVKGFTKPIAVFIQAKHRENEEQTLKTDLETYFNSYLKIRQLFHPKNNDLFFRGSFDETECFFVIYTNVKIDLNNDSVESDFSAKLKDLIDTRDKIQQLHKYKDTHTHRYTYTDRDTDHRILSVEDQVALLAKRIAQFIIGEMDFQMIMTDEHVLRYHVILGEKVFDVSEIEHDGYRMACFRNDFFDTNENYLVLFKDTLFKEILKKRTIKPEIFKKRTIKPEIIKKQTIKTDINKLLSEHLDDPYARRLEFDKQSTKDFRPDMQPMEVSESTVNEAEELGPREILLSMHLKVPVAFGNKDLTICGSDTKIQKRIHYLANIIIHLLDNCKSSKMVTIDESLEKGFLQLNGGIAGAIGNIFVLDDNTKLMKITDNEESLGTLANKLYRILKSEIHNMHEYKFCFKVVIFPKLLFECIRIDTRGPDRHKYKKNIEYLTKIAVKDQITSLAERIAKFIMCKLNFRMILTDEYVLRYHLILAQKVFEVSEIQPDEYRIASIRNDFFDTNEEHLIVFKDTLFKEILKMRTITPADKRLFLSEYLAEPTDAKRLSKLIGTVITYRNGQLEFNKQHTIDFRLDMKPLDVSGSTVNEAVEMAAKEILSSMHFKVPVAFGNKDLTIRSTNAKIEKRINHLAIKIINLLDEYNYKSSKMITIDESLEKGFLQLNGGIAGAIGNIFLFDDNTKLMKITDNWESLGTLAKRLYSKLNSEIHNLHEYKFRFKVDKFPKLSFGEYGEDLARDFLNKLLFYSNQSNECGVEEKIKVEIEDYQLNQPNYFQVKTDAIFSKYHDVVQRWWMNPKPAPYLTRNSDLFQNAIQSVIEDSLMNSINLTYMNKIKNNNYTFTEDAVSALNLQDQHSTTVVVAENSVLTVAKVVQHLKSKDHVVLDLEYIANLPRNDQNALRSELAYTNEGKVLILVCDKIDSGNGMKTLEDISKAVRSKTTIIITNETLLQLINKYFPNADAILYDKKLSLVDLSNESQGSILKAATAIFPGVEMKLNELLSGWPKTGLR